MGIRGVIKILAEILHQIAGQFEQEEHDYYPRPSLAGKDRCIRQLVYWGKKTPRKQLPGRTFHIFNDGNFHEELTNDWIRKSAFRLHSEQMKVDIGEKYGIKLKGSIDGIITDVLGLDYLLEIKGINHFTYQRYCNGEIPVDYVTQVCLYLEGLRKINPDITKGILLVKNKNTSAFMEFIIRLVEGSAVIEKRMDSQGETVEMNEVIEDIVDDAFHAFAEVRQHITDNTLPPRQYDMDHWRCEYCSYRKTCYEGYEDEFGSLATDASLEGEIVELAKYYLESNMHLTEMKKEKDGLRGQIVTLLKGKEVRKGKAGDYGITLTLQKRQTVDKDKIPANLLPKYLKDSFSEILRITKKKEKENGK